MRSYLNVPISVSESLEARGLTTFKKLVEKANLTVDLDTLTGVTILASSDTIMAANLNITDVTMSTLQSFVKGHVVHGFVGFLPLLKDGLVLTTLAGTQLKVTVKGGDVFINDTQIKLSNTITENGVVHAIDKVSLK
jgi:uncharacterized surface protein with fasciclin (FAS1) repeats